MTPAARWELDKWRQEFADLASTFGADKMAAGAAIMNTQEERDEALAKCHESFKKLLDRIYGARPAPTRKAK